MTRASALGSASATTHSRHRDNSREDMAAIPHTISLQGGHNRTPAFIESRAGNACAEVYADSHESIVVCRIRAGDRTLFDGPGVTPGRGLDAKHLSAYTDT